METTHYEMTARDYLRVLFRQKLVIITCIITVMATVFIGLKLKTPVYESQVKMLISAEKQVDSPYYRELIEGHNVEASLTQSEIVTSNPVIERAVLALKLNERPLDYEKHFCSPLKASLIDAKTRSFSRKIESLSAEERSMLFFRNAVESLRASIKVEPVRDTNLFVIRVKDYSPIGAATIANVVSRSYVIFDLEQQLAELQVKYGAKYLTVQQLRDNIVTMTLNTLSGQPLANIDAIGPASVKIIEQAQIPLRPSGPPKMTIMALAVFMSVFLGVMLAFVFEYMDPTFKTVMDVESFFNMPFLGSVPKQKGSNKILLKDLKRQNTYSGFYRTLAEQLYLIMRDKQFKSIIITSAERKEGSSTITANLGHYLSRSMNHNVLLIDANLRNPHLHKFHNVHSTSGLAGILEGKVSFDEAVKSADGKLYILPAGTTDLNPITLLDSTMMQDICKRARDRFEIVLIDAPCLNTYKDAGVLAMYADATALVISEGRSRRQVLKTLLGQFENRRAHIMGVILNNRSFPIPRMIYDRI